MSEDVQPEVTEAPMEAVSEGQGNTPYGEYLDKLPEDIRESVEPVFKEWDSNVTKRFQEAADFRKTWEPFQDLGLTEVPRDELENLIALRELAASNPDGFDAWLRDTAQERGILGQEGVEEDPFADDPMLNDQLDPMMSKLQELEQWKEQQEYESRVSEAMKVVEQQVKDASEKYPDVPQDLAEQFLSSFAESDPENAVNLAYEAAQKWIAQIQQGMVTDKLAQPEAAEGGSRADGSPEDIKDFRAASAQALARLKESQ